MKATFILPLLQETWKKLCPWGVKCDHAVIFNMKWSLLIVIAVIRGRKVARAAPAPRSAGVRRIFPRGISSNYTHFLEVFFGGQFDSESQKKTGGCEDNRSRQEIPQECRKLMILWIYRYIMFTWKIIDEKWLLPPERQESLLPKSHEMICWYVYEICWAYFENLLSIPARAPCGADHNYVWLLY